jgi:hypothetical protein
VGVLLTWQVVSIGVRWRPSLTAAIVTQLVTSRCTIRVRPCSPGGPGGWYSPCGGAVGDQPGDGEDGLLEGVAAPGPALQGSPLLGFGDGVLDADPG